jgi:serine O-acetyltransferase
MTATSAWRADLEANAARTGVCGALVAWFMNPGFAVICLHRWAHWGRRRGGFAGRMVSRLAWRRVVSAYGCHLDPAAVLGPGVRLPHPIGIVIGAGAVIGARSTIYQHVTIGRRSSEAAEYPRLGEGVLVYAGATLLGPIEIGDAATIGAHALVIQDVPAGARASAPAAVIRSGPR